MRFIDLALIIGDQEARPAIAAAEDARREILAEPDNAKRRQLIKDHRGKWVAFRAHFQRIYGEKCWYTECTNPGTDDDVDHYRPKGRVDEDLEHGGYWWEALNWKNFRLSCHRANRLRENPESGDTQGKGNHFPIQSEDARWRDPLLACHEIPLLLDPTKPRDPGYLTYDINGAVALAPRYSNNPQAQLRFEKSRAYLHLDWPSIKQQRQMLHTEIVKKIDEGNEAQASIDRGEPAGRAWLDRVAGSLISFAEARQPYSRAAQAFIRHYRFYEWIEDEVLPHIPSIEPPPESAAAAAIAAGNLA